MFGWDSGEIGTELADDPEAEARRGCRGADRWSTTRAPTPTATTRTCTATSCDAGAQVVANDTIQLDFDGLFVDRGFDWRQDEFGRAEHRKLYVIDGIVAWTGGAGIQDHFADGRFHDVMVRVTGDVVRQAQAVFLTASGPTAAPCPTTSPSTSRHQPEPGTLPTALVQVVPGGYVSATQATRELIDTATTRLDLMNPYLTDADMHPTPDRRRRARRATSAVVVAETSNNKYAEAALSHHYRDLIDAGVEVWEYPGAVVHAKIVVADDRSVSARSTSTRGRSTATSNWAMIVEDPATASCSRRACSNPTSPARNRASRRAACGIAARRGCGTRSATSSDHDHARTYTHLQPEIPRDGL